MYSFPVMIIVPYIFRLCTLLPIFSLSAHNLPPLSTGWNSASSRAAAQKFSISKSTVHMVVVK